MQSRSASDCLLPPLCLRDHLGLTGTHIGCDTSQCGACTVHMDGRSVKSCTVLVGQANGSSITTMKNNKGVRVTLRATKEGAQLTAGPEGMKITLE